MKSKQLLIAAAVLVAVGVFLMVFPFNNAELECAADDQVTSGFFDDEKDCPISIESFEEVRAEESRFKIERVAGLGLIIVGVGLGGVGAMRGRRRATV